jgi:hypothetical protein
VLLHWDAGSGAPTTLAKIPLAPGTYALGVRAVGVGNGWLVAYDTAKNTGGATRNAVVVAADGSVSSPSAMPGSCGMGLVGFVRSANTALLTDACAGATLYNLSGQALKSYTFTVSSQSDTSCYGSYLSGGQVAFNGIDYLGEPSSGGDAGPTSGQASGTAGQGAVAGHVGKARHSLGSPSKGCTVCWAWLEQLLAPSARRSTDHDRR